MMLWVQDNDSLDGKDHAVEVVTVAMIEVDIYEVEATVKADVTIGVGILPEVTIQEKVTVEVEVAE